MDGLVYSEYLALISSSKYVISCGEGLDGYFVEPFHCGSVGAAIYNNILFPDNFGRLTTLYESLEDLAVRLPGEIAAFEERPHTYDAYSHEIGQRFSISRSWEVFRNILQRFYSGQYTFTPRSLP